MRPPMMTLYKSMRNTMTTTPHLMHGHKFKDHDYDGGVTKTTGLNMQKRDRLQMITCFICV